MKARTEAKEIPNGNARLREVGFSPKVVLDTRKSIITTSGKSIHVDCKRIIRTSNDRFLLGTLVDLQCHDKTRKALMIAPESALKSNDGVRNFSRAGGFLGIGTYSKCGRIPIPRTGRLTTLFPVGVIYTEMEDALAVIFEEEMLGEPIPA
ncbi:MAG: hypothetical protein AAB652_00565 [Patescibacteria group bacterium]